MQRPILVGLLAIAALAGIVFALARLHGGDGQAVVVVEDTPEPTRSAEPSIVVDVAGAVVHPGVYRLAAGSRIADALAAAGGATDDADLAALNKAAPVRDGQRVYVPGPVRPSPQEAPAATRSSRSTSITRPRPSSRRFPGSGRPSRLGSCDRGAVTRSRGSRSCKRAVW